MSGKQRETEIAAQTLDATIIEAAFEAARRYPDIGIRCPWCAQSCLGAAYSAHAETHLRQAERHVDMEKTDGQIGYEAYCAVTGWKSLVTGALLPPWTALDDKIKEAWEAVGSALAQRRSGTSQ